MSVTAASSTGDGLPPQVASFRSSRIGAEFGEVEFASPEAAVVFNAAMKELHNRGEAAVPVRRLPRITATGLNTGPVSVLT